MMRDTGVERLKRATVLRVVLAAKLHQPLLRVVALPRLRANAPPGGIEVNQRLGPGAAGRAARARHLCQNLEVFILEHSLHLRRQSHQVKVLAGHLLASGWRVGQGAQGVVAHPCQLVQRGKCIGIDPVRFHAAVHQAEAPAVRE